MIKIKLSKTNCYLLQISEGYLLIDTGYEIDKPIFFKKLRKNHINIQKIRYIFLTHHHDDHSGLLNEIININPDIQIIMHEKCSELLKSGKNSMEYGGKWCCRNMKRAAELYRKINKNWSLRFPPYFTRENDIILESRDIDLEPITGVKLTSVYSPGHTIDSISLIDQSMNLFCGDAAANFMRFLGTKYAPPFVTDLPQMYETWQKFLNLGVKKIYPSHGKPIKISALKNNMHKLSQKKLGKFSWD